MQWFYLVLAGGFEVVWATFMKMSHGFSRLGFTLVAVELGHHIFDPCSKFIANLIGLTLEFSQN